jgi:hypothetical protein
VVLDPHRWLGLRQFRPLYESGAMNLREIARETGLNVVVANNRLHRNNKTKIKDGGVFNNWGGTWTDQIDGRPVTRTNRNDGVMRNNRIILTDNAQSYDTSPKGPPPRPGSLVFDNTNRVYNASGALVFPKVQ